MIKRIYIDNYRCFSNFELRLDDLPCSMIIGGNGTGKSTVGEVLGIFRAIGLGASNINGVMPRDAKSVLAQKVDGKHSNVITLELDACDEDRAWRYSLTVESLGLGYSVKEERLVSADTNVFDRSSLNLSETTIAMAVVGDGVSDRTLVADFRKVLSAIYIVRPNPRLMGDLLDDVGASPTTDLSNFANWLPGILSSSQVVYEIFTDYMSFVLQDFRGVEILNTVRDGQRLMVRFKAGRKPEEVMSITFSALSDGEKCQMVAGAIVALNARIPNVTVFWDEPDNYITTSEITNLLVALCNRFQRKGQLIVSSHSREAIAAFGENEVLCFRRMSHYSSVRQPERVDEMRAGGVLSGALDEALLMGGLVNE